MGTSDETESGETTAETSDSGVLPGYIHGRSLVGALLLGVLVPVMWVGGSFRGAVGAVTGLAFPLYFLVGTYRPWRDAIPYYDQLLAFPVLLYGLFLVSTEGPSLLGVLFVALGVLGIGQILHNWYVETDVPEPE